MDLNIHLSYSDFYKVLQIHFWLNHRILKKNSFQFLFSWKANQNSVTENTLDEIKPKPYFSGVSRKESMIRLMSNAHNKQQRNRVVHEGRGSREPHPHWSIGAVEACGLHEAYLACQVAVRLGISVRRRSGLAQVSVGGRLRPTDTAHRGGPTFGAAARRLVATPPTARGRLF